MSDKSKGLYGKFIVTRTDGKDAIGEKHDGCNYFVIDINHDKFAAFAIMAYALTCVKEGYVELSKDLRKTIADMQEDGLVRVIDDTVMVLTEEGLSLKRDFEDVEEELGGCSCHIHPPCGHCVHPGNPSNLEESQELWITLSIK